VVGSCGIGRVTCIGLAEEGSVWVIHCVRSLGRGGARVSIRTRKTIILYISQIKRENENQ
jgi:NAD(P)-dependent dehydrogenase (short-subunit alcohol dehydrogenase family)